MDIGLLHSHRLFVILFALNLLIKVILLVANQKTLLTTYSGKMKIPGIVIDSLMLATGVGLAFRSPVGFSPIYLALLGFTVALVPIGIIALKRSKPALGVLALAIVAYSYGLAQTRSFALQSPAKQSAAASVTYAANPTEQGKALYQISCERCHGASGNANYMKAKDLTATAFTDDLKAQWIKNGANTMPAHPYLNDEQVKVLVAYVNTLKK